MRRCFLAAAAPGCGAESERRQNDTGKRLQRPIRMVGDGAARKADDEQNSLDYLALPLDALLAVIATSAGHFSKSTLGHSLGRGPGA